MKIMEYPLIIISFLLSFSIIGAEAQTINNGLLFTVNHNGDSHDAVPGDYICGDAEGRCTLRAAIQEANAGFGNDIIIFALPAPAVIELTLGSLSVTSNVSIIGPGARRLTVQRSFSSGTPDFRVFFISSNDRINSTIHGLKISNGSAENNLPGGGIYIGPQSTVNLTDLAITGNSAKSGGGIANAGVLTVTRSLINSNTAQQGGAFLSIDPASRANISNSTITDNTAVDGGAFYNNGNLLLENNTISHNIATNTASSIVNISTGTINVLNTIIGSNNSSTAANSLSGEFNSWGNNIITDAQGSSGFTNGIKNDQVSNNGAINPLLGPLTDNGGQTDTRALMNGSPAINKGNSCVTTANCPGTSSIIQLLSDQRANYRRRVGDSVDVGAFEFGATPIFGAASFGARIFGSVVRIVNSFAILTNARTGEKFYSSIRPAGNFSFQNLALNDVYILEIKSKRAGLFSPQIIRFDSFSIGVFFKANIKSEEVTITENK